MISTFHTQGVTLVPNHKVKSSKVSSLIDNFRTFRTAKGMISVDEVETNIFHVYGYRLQDNQQAIPVVRQENQLTCENVIFEFLRFGYFSEAYLQVTSLGLSRMARFFEINGLCGQVRSSKLHTERLRISP